MCLLFAHMAESTAAGKHVTEKGFICEVETKRSKNEGYSRLRLIKKHFREGSKAAFDLVVKLFI